MVIPPTFLEHGHFQKSSAGPYKHHKSFWTQVQLIAWPGHLSTGKENRFLCWVEENNKHRKIAFVCNLKMLFLVETADVTKQKTAILFRRN